MCWITMIFRTNVVKYLESLVCENNCHTMSRNGRFWLFYVSDSIQQANEVACLFIFYVVYHEPDDEYKTKTVPNPPK